MRQNIGHRFSLPRRQDSLMAFGEVKKSAILEGHIAAKVTLLVGSSGSALNPLDSAATSILAREPNIKQNNR